MEALYDVLKVIFTVSAGCGGLFLIVVPIGAAVALSDGLRGRLLRRVPAWTVAELLSTKSRPRRVAVRAVTVAGPSAEPSAGSFAGSQPACRAPASGTPCLWFRVTVLRIDKVSTESGYTWNEVVVWSYSSGGTVRVDDGTGTVPVEVSLLERALDGEGGLVERSRREPIVGDEPPDLPHVGPVPRAALRRNRNTEEFTLVEELVRDDVTATLFARPVHRNGQLVLAGGGGYRVGITGLTHAEVVARYSGEAREGWWLVRFLLISGGVAYLCGMGGALLVEWIR